MARIGHNDAGKSRGDSVREPERASRGSDSPEMRRDGSEQGSGAICRAQPVSGAAEGGVESGRGPVAEAKQSDRVIGGTVREHGPSQRSGCTSKNDAEPRDESPTGTAASEGCPEGDLPGDFALRGDRRQIEHEGIVERVEGERVYVKITSRSACGSCRARQACGLAEAQEKIVEVRTTETVHFAPGEAVTVGIRRRAGGVAVLLAYGGGLAVLLAVLFCGIGLWGWAEGSAAAAALGGVAVYYVVLWACRRKIEHTIKFTITKI